MASNDNGTEYCSAENRLDVYQKSGTYSSSTTSGSCIATAPTTTAAPTATVSPQIKQTIGNWAFQGCWTEGTSGRALSSNTYAADSMTLESCAAFYSGFSMFGVEYGRECWCGNSLNFNGYASRTPAMNVSDGNCGFTCPGNSSEFCRSGNHLSLYWFDVKKATLNNGTA